KHQAADAPPGYYDDSPNLVYFGHDPKHPELPRHWRIRLKVDALKNRGTTITEDHDVPLADFVQEPLTRWVEEVRPRTPDAMAGSKYLFTRVRERADLGRDGFARKLMPLTIDGLGMLMAKMTRLYLPDIVLPTGDSAEELEERVHWLRHVVATHMLKTGSSIDAVATALLDHHQTVQRVYAFVVPADFAEEHNKAIDAAFRSFRRFAKAA